MSKTSTFLILVSVVYMLLKIKKFKYLKQINFEINKKEVNNLFKKCSSIIAVVITSVSVLAVSLRWVGSDADFVGLTGGDECVPAYKHQSMYTVISYFQPPYMYI